MFGTVGTIIAGIDAAYKAKQLLKGLWAFRGAIASLGNLSRKSAHARSVLNKMTTDEVEILRSIKSLAFGSLTEQFVFCDPRYISSVEKFPSYREIQTLSRLGLVRCNPMGLSIPIRPDGEVLNYGDFFIKMETIDKYPRRTCIQCLTITPLGIELLDFVDFTPNLRYLWQLSKFLFTQGVYLYPSKGH